MHDPPPDLDPARLAEELVAGWGLRPVTLRHLPVGFGGYHWRAMDAAGRVGFVSVAEIKHAAGPDTAFDHLMRALRTAMALRESADLGFVIAPLPDGRGVPLRRLCHHYAVHLAPFVYGTTRGFGAARTARERRRLASAIGRLHAATTRLPTDLAPREDFALQARDVLERALEDLARPWTTGPYAEPTRRRLEARARHLVRELQAYDAGVARLRRRGSPWVVTHGEPHPGNVIAGPNARLALVDWDTVALAPAERDLHLLLGRRLAAWRAYRRTAGAAATMERAALDLYRTRWRLTDVATAVATLRRAEARSADAEVSWRALRGALAD